MTTPIFDNEGLAIEPGTIRCFYYDKKTMEYVGWSDEFIHKGVSLPGSCTILDPGDDAPGKEYVFDGELWVSYEDNRGKVEYSTSTQQSHIIDYIGTVRDGFTLIAPNSQHDTWNGSSWVIDSNAEKQAAIVEAELERQRRIAEANEFMNSRQWPGKAAVGILGGGDLARYKAWLGYLDELYAVDTSTAPNVEWPEKPE